MSRGWVCLAYLCLASPVAAQELDDGDACTDAAACESGFCVDGVCCESACGGGADDCQACSEAVGAALDGECGPLSAALAPTITCRSSAGSCDVAEVCSDTSTICPNDAFDEGTECRAANGPCDVPETCLGASAGCPPDVVVPSSLVCRPSAGPCDAEETCDGESAACPEDQAMTAGTVCRPAQSACDVAETCDGVEAACSPDVLMDDGSGCGEDGDRCSGNRSCRLGVCVEGAMVDCDDENPCTADACDSVSGCTHDTIAGCCVESADCDDGDACTSDHCSVENVCFARAIEACQPTDAGQSPAEDAGGSTRDAGQIDAGAPDATINSAVGGGVRCSVGRGDRSTAGWLLLIAFALVGGRRALRAST